MNTVHIQLRLMDLLFLYLLHLSEWGISLLVHRGRRSSHSNDDQHGGSLCSFGRRMSSRERMSHWSSQPKKGTLSLTTRGRSWVLSRPYVSERIRKFFLNQNFINCKMLQPKCENENKNLNYWCQSIRWLGAGWKTRALDGNLAWHEDSWGSSGYRARRVVSEGRHFP